MRTERAPKLQLSRPFLRLAAPVTALLITFHYIICTITAILAKANNPRQHRTNYRQATPRPAPPGQETPTLNLETLISRVRSYTNTG